MRKNKPKKRVILPDSRYNDPVVTRFVNMLMFDGKKSVAFRVFYDAMDIIEKKNEEGAHKTFQKALENVMPAVEVRSRRVGGSTFQIPTEIRPSRRMSVAMKWLINAARKRTGKGMPIKLSTEIQSAAKGEGAAVKKREDTHRMAESNKAFAHFIRR